MHIEGWWCVRVRVHVWLQKATGGVCSLGLPRGPWDWTQLLRLGTSPFTPWAISPSFHPFCFWIWWEILCSLRWWTWNDHFGWFLTVPSGSFWLYLLPDYFFTFQCWFLPELILLLTNEVIIINRTFVTERVQSFSGRVHWGSWKHVFVVGPYSQMLCSTPAMYSMASLYTYLKKLLLLPLKAIGYISSFGA